MSQPLAISLIIAAYFAVWLIVSYFSSRGADNSTFFSGGRKLAWPLVALAMIGAPISGVTFISVPGMVVGKGYSYLQMCIGFIIGYLVIAFVLVPLYYRLNIVSIYSYLQRRFGQASYKTGAWLFFASKLLGISVRFLVVCIMLQFLVFDPLGIPYIFSVMVSMTMVWITTYRGGVKSVVWGDALKSVCLISAIALTLYFMLDNLGYSISELPGLIERHETSKIFFLDDAADGKYFWKQVIAGIFLVVAMTGLDQDMMQRTLACRNARDSRKNLMVSSVMQAVVISFLLILGTLLTIYSETTGIEIPAKTDNLFATVAFHSDIPFIVGALFVLGLVAATYSSVGSALTAMTTTMTVDIMEADRKTSPEALSRKRKLIHTFISIGMGVLVIFFFYLNEEDAISTIYRLVSYSDGPILGLFLFGILTRRQVNERWLPLACILAPIISWIIQWGAKEYFIYQIGFELLIINAGVTMLGLWLLSLKTVEQQQGESVTA